MLNKFRANEFRVIDYVKHWKPIFEAKSFIELSSQQLIR